MAGDIQEQFGINFEEPADQEREEIEFVNEEDAEVETSEGEGDTPPQMTKEEIEELRKKAEANERNNDIFARLGDTLEKVGSAVNRPANVPPNPGVVSDEEYAKRFEEGIFTRDKGFATFREAVQREVTPVIQNLQAMTVQQSKRLLELDPEKGTYFKKFSGEIENVVQNLPPAQRIMPGVYDWAYDKVMAAKAPEIAKEQADALVLSKVDELVNQKLKELGIDPTSPRRPSGPPSARRPFSEASQESRGQVNRGTVRKVVITAADRQAAQAIGMDIRDYMLTK